MVELVDGRYVARVHHSFTYSNMQFEWSRILWYVRRSIPVSMFMFHSMNTYATPTEVKDRRNDLIEYYHAHALNIEPAVYTSTEKVLALVQCLTCRICMLNGVYDRTRRHAGILILLNASQRLSYCHL